MYEHVTDRFVAQDPVGDLALEEEAPFVHVGPHNVAGPDLQLVLRNEVLGIRVKITSVVLDVLEGPEHFIKQHVENLKRLAFAHNALSTEAKCHLKRNKTIRTEHGFFSF